jgi:hypothetical protein
MSKIRFFDSNHLCMNMKKCPKCQREKSNCEYYLRSNGKPQSYCKQCFSKYCVVRWIEKKKRAVEYKGGICVDCSKSFDYYLFDFHHIDPNTKSYDWAQLRLYGWKRIKKELDKCLLLCCLCHRIREHKWMVAPQGIEPCSIA